ncbi:MAG: Fic family protein [Corynebacterium sp.]|uniref:Fic family protein n=1 Tax=Corynebacterium sp. TaxID=1720 RepID=UPI0026DD727E|nr:Fic family protein [Corynebacterium sp.]MDO5099389.1 Fic family protein [Corynebacterium sp.]
MSPKKSSQQTDEERVAAFLVSLACELNKRCGKRKTSEGVPEAYSGYSVEKDLLESAVYAPFQVFSNHRPRYASPYDRAAALIVHIAKGHPFGDGNKRTALHLGLSYLRYLSIHITEPDGEAGSRFVEENRHQFATI